MRDDRPRPDVQPGGHPVRRHRRMDRDQAKRRSERSERSAPTLGGGALSRRQSRARLPYAFAFIEGGPVGQSGLLNAHSGSLGNSSRCACVGRPRPAARRSGLDKQGDRRLAAQIAKSRGRTAGCVGWTFGPVAELGRVPLGARGLRRPMPEPSTSPVRTISHNLTGSINKYTYQVLTTSTSTFVSFLTSGSPANRVLTPNPYQNTAMTAASACDERC